MSRVPLRTEVNKYNNSWLPYKNNKGRKIKKPSIYKVSIHVPRTKANILVNTLLLKRKIKK